MKALVLLALALLGAGCTAAHAQRQANQEWHAYCAPYEAWAGWIAEARDTHTAFQQITQTIDAAEEIDVQTRMQLHDLSREVYSGALESMTPRDIQQRISLRCLHHGQPTEAGYIPSLQEDGTKTPTVIVSPSQDTQRFHWGMVAPEHRPWSRPIRPQRTTTTCYVGRYLSSCTTR